MRLFPYLYGMVGAFALLLIAYAVLTVLNVHVGAFGDWVFGMLSLLWLFAIITVPWNIHFRARAVLADVEPTRERGLTVDERQVAYVSRLAKNSLRIAIALHLLSAVVLFVLAATGFSRLGYVASAMALLLTVLRPAVRAYEYLVARLRSIGDSWRYPREDIVELRSRVESMEAGVRQTQSDLDGNNTESIVAKQTRLAEDIRRDLARLTAELEALRATNEVAHEQLAREAKSAISQLSTDGQFLDHVREILRFFKSA